MRANQIRVGNTVHSTIWGKNVKVTIGNIGFHDDFVGIQITPKYLKKNGFERNGEFYTKDDLELNKEISDFETDVWEISNTFNGETISTFKFTYELENYFFAVNGIELFDKDEL